MNANEFFGHWVEARQGLLQALDLLKDAHLDFTPREGLWSLRETLVHIASAEDGWFRYGVERSNQSWDETGIERASYPTVESVRKLLIDVHQKTEDFLSRVPEDQIDRPVALPWGGQTTLRWVIWHVLEHEIHHRGEVFLMLGLLGMEGPDI